MVNQIARLFRNLAKADPIIDQGRWGQVTCWPAEDRRERPRFEQNTKAMAVWFDGDGNCRSEPVTIRDASPDGILFVTQEEFPIDQTVWIETGDHEEMMFAVKHCEQRGRRYWAGAQRVTHERRRDDRSPVLGGANLHWEHADGGRCQTLALVRNASDSGMQLESSVPLPVGTEVELSGARLRCAGSVRYCRESGHKFLIGLKITEKTIVPG